MTEIKITKQGQLQADFLKEKTNIDQESNKASFYKDYVNDETHYGLTAAAVNFYEY